jgi:hypothetical protein
VLATGLHHTILRPSLSELLEVDMPFVSRVLASFDPMALRNSVTAAHAITQAHKEGFTFGITGKPLLQHSNTSVLGACY